MQRQALGAACTRTLALLLFLLAALLGAEGACLSTASSAPERHPGAGRPLATAMDSSAWLASAAPDGLEGVRLYRLDSTSAAAGTMLSTPAISLPPRAAACDQTALGAPASYAPFHAKSLSLWGDLLAVGAPDRGDAGFSSIDIVSLSALSAAVGAGTTPAAALLDPSVASTLVSNSSSSLGVLLSLDGATGTSLASTHDGARLAVFSPLVGRASSSFDAVSSNDTWVHLPLATASSSFTLDSFSLARGVLAVTGVELDAATASCKPVLYSYTYIGATASEPNQWKVAARVALLRSTGAAATAPVNSVPCQAGPSGSLPVELSSDASRLVVGSPRQGCAYAVAVAFGSNNLQTLTVSGRCADPLLYGSEFGRSVALTSASGDTFAVASALFVTHFAFAEWTHAAGPDPLDSSVASSFFQYPNRLQAASATEASGLATTLRRVVHVVARANMTVIVQQPLADGTGAASSHLVALLASSAVPTGQQWNPATRALESCPAGRFSTGAVVGVATYAGCQLCPAGTFQSSSGASFCTPCGADTYCPTGSVAAYPASDFSTSSSSSFSSSLPYAGDMEDGVASSFHFEEILVSTVFSVTAWPAMIMLFVLIAGVALVYIGSFWADGDGDEQDCCSSMGNCCLHSYRLLGRFKYWSVGRAGPFPYTQRDPTTAPDVIQYGAHGSVQQQGTVVQKPDGSVTHTVRNEDGSVTTVTTSALDPHAECAAHSQRSPECEGFITLVFLLFGLSVVCFTGIYLASYDPLSVEGSSFQNVYRRRVEYARSSDTEPEYAQGMDALMHNAFTMQISFVGLSAPLDHGCTPALVRALSWEGCTVPALSSAGTGPRSCASVYAGASSLAWSQSTAHTCVLSLEVPGGVSLASSSALRLTLPTSVSFQALRFSFHQNASQVALSLPAQGTQGSAAHEDNTAAIGGVSFTSTLSYADANTRAQRLLSPLERRWLLTPVAYRTQRSDQWADRYDTTWYAEARDEDAATPVLPSQSPTASRYGDADSDSGVLGLSSTQTVQLSIRVSDRWTLKQTQRLMGGQSVLWVMILAVVAVYHLLSFAESLYAIAVHSCCRGQRAKQLRVAQTREPGQPVQMATRHPHEHQHDPHSPLPLHHPYPHSTLPVGALPPIAGSWSHYEQSRPYDQRLQLPSLPLTPSRPYPFGPGSPPAGAGAGLPSTPHALHFQSRPGTSLAEDRARYQAARARAADDRIDIELARGHQRGGFEV